MPPLREPPPLLKPPPLEERLKLPLLLLELRLKLLLLLLMLEVRLKLPLVLRTLVVDLAAEEDALLLVLLELNRPRELPLKSIVPVLPLREYKLPPP